MSEAVNLRIDPRTGVKNWTAAFSEELVVEELVELAATGDPPVFGVVLTQVPHPTSIEVYRALDPSVALTRITTVGEPGSTQFWSDSQQLKPRGYVIVNSTLYAEGLIIVYRGGGYLAHKRNLETVIPIGPPGPAGGVDTVFGRSGNVVAATSDYTQDQVTDGSTYKQFSATEKTKLADIEVDANKWPVGSYIQHAGASAPTGFVACDGASLLRAGTYANLFAVIGTTYGAADGTHFNVPDARGLVMVGAGANGTLTRADASAYNGGAVGASRNDQMQGFRSDIYGINFLQSGSGAADNIYIGTNGNNNTKGPADVIRGPSDDGTNGTPRIGNETRPAEIAVLTCIRY